MSLTTQTTKNESSASIQKDDSAVVVPTTGKTVVVSTSNYGNDVGQYGMQVVVRAATTRNVTIPIDIAREQTRYENLTANRGVKTYSTSGED
ncbi:MAG: hypothetical protein KF751_06225 [Nitrospira sp.]|nr:hypothetical protein [Nitrospira sp.]